MKFTYQDKIYSVSWKYENDKLNEIFEKLPHTKSLFIRMRKENKTKTKTERKKALNQFFKDFGIPEECKIPTTTTCIVDFKEESCTGDEATFSATVKKYHKDQFSRKKARFYSLRAVLEKMYIEKEERKAFWDVFNNKPSEVAEVK